jgi:hypothetical protein
MFNCVRKEDIDYSPYEEGEWRSAIFHLSLFLSCLFLFLFPLADVILIFQLFWFSSVRSPSENWIVLLNWFFLSAGSGGFTLKGDFWTISLCSTPCLVTPRAFIYYSDNDFAILCWFLQYWCVKSCDFNIN